MKKLVSCLLAIAVMGSISACSSTLTATNLNDQGRFDANTQVDPEDVQITKPFKSEWGKMVVVADFTESNGMNDFNYQMIQNLGKFETVYDKDKLEQYVLSNRIDGVTDTTSILSLNKLAEREGPFLLIRPYAEHRGGYDFSGALEAVDVQTGDAVFRVDKGAFNWAGLDKPLFYPIYNALMDWVEGKTEPNSQKIIRPDSPEGKARTEARKATKK